MTCRGANSYRANRCLLSRSGRPVPPRFGRRAPTRVDPRDCTAPGTSSWKKSARGGMKVRCRAPQENNCEPLPALSVLQVPGAYTPTSRPVWVRAGPSSRCRRAMLLKSSLPSLHRFTESRRAPCRSGSTAPRHPPPDNPCHRSAPRWPQPIDAFRMRCPLVVDGHQRLASPRMRERRVDGSESRRCRTASTRIRSDFCG